MKRIIIAFLTAGSIGCATLTEDAMTPIAISFSNGSPGECQLTNKRGVWSTDIPTTLSVRKSDDALKYECETNGGDEVVGTIASEMGGKIIASAVFLDFGITDAITDKHRQYPASFVIPVVPETEPGSNDIDPSATAENAENAESMDQPVETKDVYAELEKLDDLRERGILTDAEFDTEKKKLLERN